MPLPEFWIIAGPNGAGKTTLAQAQPISNLLPDVRFLNPDDKARELLTEKGHAGFSDAPPQVLREAFLAAANQVQTELNAALGRGEAVGVETVLSSDKYRPLVEFVRQQGGFVGLIYVMLASPEVACARVERRVRNGGHDVPPDKIHNRWHRSLANLAWFATRASMFWIFDNSDENPEVAPRLVAKGRMGTLEFIDASIHQALRSALSALPGG